MPMLIEGTTKPKPFLSIQSTALGVPNVVDWIYWCLSFFCWFSCSLQCLSRLASAHSGSLPHVLMHAHLRENDISWFVSSWVFSDSGLHAIPVCIAAYITVDSRHRGELWVLSPSLLLLSLPHSPPLWSFPPLHSSLPFPISPFLPPSLPPSLTPSFPPSLPPLSLPFPISLRKHDIGQGWCDSGFPHHLRNNHKRF